MTRRRVGPQVKWHRFLAKGFELSIGQTGVLVFAEVEVTQNPPKVDILLLRRQTETWTPEQLALLPDGIRDCNASHILIEFKYTESLTIDAIRQAVSYEYFYRTGNELTPDTVRMFLLCAKTPSPQHLHAFGYAASHLTGVYESQQELIEHIPLLVLNELSDVPHNAFVKAFASRPAQKAKAFAQIRGQAHLSDELVTYFEVLGALWSLPEGVTMDEVLTPERVLEIGREWKRIFIQHAQPDELNELLPPELKEQFIKQGIERGIEQGIEQGIERGIEQGIEQKTYDIVLAMAAKGFDQTVIADIVGLTAEQVQALLVASAAPGTNQEVT